MRVTVVLGALRVRGEVPAQVNKAVDVEPGYVGEKKIQGPADGHPGSDCMCRSGKLSSTDSLVFFRSKFSDCVETLTPLLGSSHQPSGWVVVQCAETTPVCATFQTCGRWNKASGWIRKTNQASILFPGDRKKFFVFFLDIIANDDG